MFNKFWENKGEKETFLLGIALFVMVALFMVIIHLENRSSSERDEKRIGDYEALWELFNEEMDTTDYQRNKIVEQEKEIDDLRSHIKELSALSPLFGLLSPDDIDSILLSLTPASPFDSDLRVTSRFGEGIGYQGALRKGHRGTDIVPKGNLKILGMWDGTVTDIGIHEYLGKYVIITHAPNIRTLYAHMDKIYYRADVGTKQKQGEVLGLMGDTGKTSGAHLHIELQIFDGQAWVPVDIYPFLKR